MSTLPNPKPSSLRNALLLLLTLGTAVIGGYLYYMETMSGTLSILTGVTMFAAAWRFYNEIISE